MNILIVEDDVLLQNWLSMLLNSLPVYQPRVLKAGDGLEALEICRKNPVDLVITDIKMPRMDGLELIQQLKAEFPRVRTAVLSSYDDFSFAKVALKYGALDYILKAEMTVDDISQLLDKVRSGYQIEKAVQDGTSVDYQALSGRQKDFGTFLSGELEVSDFLAKQSLPASPPVIAILLMHLRELSSVDIPIFLAAEICRQTLQMENLTGSAFPYRRENCVLLYCPSSTVSEYCEAEVAKLRTVIKNNLERYLKSYSVSSIHVFCHQRDQLRSHCQQLCKTLDCQQYYGDSEPCCHRLDSFTAYKQRLQHALDAGHLPEAAAVVQAYLREAHQRHLEPEVLRSSMLFLLNLFFAVLQSKLPVDAVDLLHENIHAIAGADTRLSLEKLANDFLEELRKIQEQSLLTLSPVIRTALVYIGKNYSGKITLDNVASQLSMNRSYLSQLFKKETGKTFGDYVEQIRIEKAKELLSGSEASIIHIAEQTGFNNQNYFTKVFKASTGVSPLHYRKLHFHCE